MLQNHSSGLRKSSGVSLYSALRGMPAYGYINADMARLYNRLSFSDLLEDLSQVLAHPGNAADNENDTLNSCDKPER